MVINLTKKFLKEIFCKKCLGEISMGCGNFCRIVCCVQNSENSQEPLEVRRLGEGLKIIEKKLDSLDRRSKNENIKTENEREEENKKEEEKVKEMDFKRWIELKPFNRFLKENLLIFNLKNIKF